MEVGAVLELLEGEHVVEGHDRSDREAEVESEQEVFAFVRLAK